MYSYAVTLFVFLCISLALSSLRTGGWATFARIIQWLVTLISAIFLIWWIFEKSLSNIYGKNYDNLSIKITNRLPENIDFYVIKCHENSDTEACIDHLGKIKQNYYRKLFLNSHQTNEFQLLGFVDSKKLVYHSLHSAEKKVLEIDTYTNQEQNTSDSIVKKISDYTDIIIEKSILVSLNFFLIFLHFAFLTKKENLLNIK